MSGLLDPADDGFVITPSDTEDLDVPTRGLYVGVSGDVKVDMLTGTTLIWIGLAAGIIVGISAAYSQKWLYQFSWHRECPSQRRRRPRRWP